MHIVTKTKFFQTVLISFMIVALFSSPLQARAVSYPGGWTVMQMNDYYMNSLHIHYSPTAKYSIGYKAAYWPGKDFQTHVVQVNNLLKRWNNFDSQANIYLKSGVGLAYEAGGDYSDDVEPHAHTGFSMDWENRRFFTQYGNTYYYSRNIDKEYREFVRVGVAPYIGEYGDLHTWVMLKIEHNPEDSDNFTATPHLRFFKNEYLFEIGYSEKKEILVNWVVRF